MNRPPIWEIESHGQENQQTGIGRQFVLSMLFCLLVLPWSGSAAHSTDSELDYPLALVHATSIQRLRDNAGIMFDSAERKDMTDRVDQWLANTLKDAKGIDRTKPFGMMLYLRPEIFGPPLGISYLPVSNLNDALETFANGTGTVVPVEGKPDRYEIQYTEIFKVRALYRSGYLFLVGPDGDSSSLDREFPDPEKLTARLASQYDVALSFMIKSIPVGLKTVMLSYFKNQSQADLQQRDDEPESVYRLRRANGEIWIELIEKIVNQGNEITLGVRMDGEQKSASVELEVAGTRDSKLAKFFQKLSGKKTYFGNLLTDSTTLMMSISVSLDDSQRKLFSTFFEAARRDLISKFDDEEDREDFQKIVDPIFKSLQTTSEVGHIDAFAKLSGTEQREFSIVAGVKHSTFREMPKKFQELLEFLLEGATSNEPISKAELGIDTIDSFPVHRVPITSTLPAGRRMFGETTYFHLYSNPQAAWGAFGSENSLQSLKDAIQKVAEPQDPSKARNIVPVQLVMHAKNWLALADDDDAPNSFVDRADASFSSDNDAMTVEIRPTEVGVRLRAEFQSGFIALMGRSITNGIENGFFRGRQGRGNPRTTQDPAESKPANDDLEK